MSDEFWNIHIIIGATKVRNTTEVVVSEVVASTARVLYLYTIKGIIRKIMIKSFMGFNTRMIMKLRWGLVVKVDQPLILYPWL
jgi:hypothetical protein